MRSDSRVCLLNSLFVSLRQSECKNFHNLVPKLEKYFKFTFNITALTYKFFAAANRVLSRWTLNEPVKSSQIFLKRPFPFNWNNNECESHWNVSWLDFFFLCQAILSRKLTVPEIHDVMWKVGQMSITGSSPSVQLQCRQVQKNKILLPI